jgi:glycosyltransferase involved in cell wall biosynthesis
VVNDVQKILVAERIDMVHSHVSIVAPVALAGGAAAQRLGLPSVLTFHSFVPATPLLAGVTGRVLSAGRWRAEMTAVSNRVAREVEAFAPGASFTLLPNAIDTAFWTPGSVASENAEVRLTYAGRLQPKKRPLLLLRVLRELKRDWGELNWSLTVVGEGTLERSLRDGVRRLGVEDKVHFAGWANPDGLRQILQRSDVFLSTATRESFGLAALEARACGVPVVAVTDSAVSDFITHEVSGLLARGDGGFAAAVVRLVRDSDLRQKIAELNRRTPVPYNWSRALEAHEAVYAKAEARVRQ